MSPKDIAWEPQRGAWEELFLGRRVLFLGAETQEGTRDLYRARIQLTHEGQPIRVNQLRNLTSTSLGDDVGLQVVDHAAVFSTLAFGTIQSINLWDLRGIPDPEHVGTWLDRVLLGVTSFQQAGTLRGIGRTHVVLEGAPNRIRYRLKSPSVLEVELAQAQPLAFTLHEGKLAAKPPQGVEVIPQVHPPKPLVLWAVDTVRAEVGPGPIAHLEKHVFALRDWGRRLSYRLSSERSVVAKLDARAHVPEVLGASGIEDRFPWPPPPIPSLWQDPKPGEGRWSSVDLPWLKAASRGGGPPLFYQTTLRPDPKRPYAEMLVIAMDMRQLELGMQAGFEDPQPLTGPAGDGRLPDEHAERVVATFNGAFKTTHGRYGMMVNRRILVPPVPGAASVVVNDMGEVGVGSWPQSEQVPQQIVSYRQNLDPLVEDGVTNPTGRYVWGWHLAGTSVMTQRTALCVTPAGHLYYAWAKEASGPTLGKALRQMGCSYGVHLDMNPGHCGFVFTNIRSLKQKDYRLKKADPGMTITADRFVKWSPKDFFYLMTRDPTPQDPSGVRWKADPGQQPPPRWYPGIFTGSIALGNLNVHLSSFEPGRVELMLSAGKLEPTRVDAPLKKTELDPEARKRVLGAVGLGHTTNSANMGLAFAGGASLPLRSSLATLVLSPGQVPRVVPPRENVELGSGDDAVQLPLLAHAGEILPAARERGSVRKHGALCFTPSGRFLVGSVEHDSVAPAVSALVRTGCKTVLALDRGSHHPAFVDRSGTSTPPKSHYEASVLYVLGKSMLPRAQRWKPKGATASTRPTGFDVPAHIRERMKQQGN